MASSVAGRLSTCRSTIVHGDALCHTELFLSLPYCILTKSHASHFMSWNSWFSCFVSYFMFHEQHRRCTELLHVGVDDEMTTYGAVSKHQNGHFGLNDRDFKKGNRTTIWQLVVAVFGIYGAFLTWALLQERISTKAYGPDKKVFRASVVLNTVQSVCASVVGLFYLQLNAPRSHLGRKWLPVFPNKKIVQKYILLAATSSLASPFGYASLRAGLDYPTFILGKTSKLLPVMALHITLYRKRYAVSKYVLVALVTIGVSLFTLMQPRKKASTTSSSSVYGLLLLSTNLILDGFTASTQDDVFHTFPQLTGPQMMCGMNAISSLITSIYLLLPVTSELSEATLFISAHPRILWDIIGFAVCGALGQAFIFFTLERFGSLVLVTVTVTRKMFSMLLSVAWFNHRLNLGQWTGVALVFGGIGGEAFLKYMEKKKAKRVF